MLKLVKYEYRRNLIGILVMLLAIVGIEGFFLWSVWRQNTDHVITASVLLFVTAMICVVGMLVYSVALYSRELNAKTSYLTFMTPNSSTKILGAKLLSALILGVFFAAVLSLTAVWDFNLLKRAFPEIDLGRVMLEEFLRASASTELSDVLTVVGAFALEFLISFFTTVVVAYLAITLSATAFQNKRLKGILSFVIFAAVMFTLQWGTGQLGAGQTYHNMREVLIGSLPQYAIYACVMLGSFFLSAWLLEKKVSL